MIRQGKGQASGEKPSLTSFVNTGITRRKGRMVGGKRRQKEGSKEGRQVCR